MSSSYDLNEFEFLDFGSLDSPNKLLLTKANFYFEVRPLPTISMMILKVSRSDSPGNKGNPLKISANIQPIDQISTD